MINHKKSKSQRKHNYARGQVQRKDLLKDLQKGDAGEINASGEEVAWDQAWDGLKWSLVVQTLDDAVYSTTQSTPFVIFSVQLVGGCRYHFVHKVGLIDSLSLPSECQEIDHIGKMWKIFESTLKIIWVQLAEHHFQFFWLPPRSFLLGMRRLSGIGSASS